jgi:ubiquinone biosynthesis monooxygenase Coq7
MNKINIIDSYKAYKVSVPKNMIPWMRSNHAGETGAVWIYIGARCVFWNKSIRDMSTDHYKTEKNHLIVMKYLVPKMKRSKLLILWRILGFFIGLISALLGFKFFCSAIEAIETFVEKHYQEQIEFLYDRSASYDLLQVLQICCNEEVDHQMEALKAKGSSVQNNYEKMWSYVIGKGSSLAVNISRVI